MRLRTGIRVTSIAVLVAACGAFAFFAWFKFSPRVTPKGQPPLTTISSVAAIRDAFNAQSQGTTILALLSPT